MFSTPIHPHGEYKIEFLALDEFGFTGMKITTGDGYTYTFGGTPELKNHSRPQSEPVSPDLYFMKFMSYKSNWPLTSIERLMAEYLNYFMIRVQRPLLIIPHTIRL